MMEEEMRKSKSEARRPRRAALLREEIAYLRRKLEDAQDNLNASRERFTALCEQLIDHHGSLPLHLRVDIEDLSSVLGAALPPLYAIRECVR
jgi:hypothetical protein